MRNIIASGTSKSRALDPVPTSIVKQFLPELLPFVTAMCNTSLQQSCLSDNQRHAIIRPRVKKQNADPSAVKNYRPISYLTFMSKVVEKLVCRQLVAYLNKHNLFSTPTLQSAYRTFHSTETSILRLSVTLCWLLIEAKSHCWGSSTSQQPSTR